MIEQFAVGGSQEEQALDRETMLHGDLSMDLSMVQHGADGGGDDGDGLTEELHRHSPPVGLTFADAMKEQGLGFMPLDIPPVDLDAMMPCTPIQNADRTLTNEIQFYQQACMDMQQLTQQNEAYVAELEQQVDQRLVDLIMGCSMTPQAPGAWPEEYENFKRLLKDAKGVSDAQIAVDWLSKLTAWSDAYTRVTFQRYATTESDYGRVVGVRSGELQAQLQGEQVKMEEVEEALTRAEERWTQVQRDAPAVQDLLKQDAEHEVRLAFLTDKIQELELEVPEMQSVQDELVLQLLELEEGGVG